MGAGATKGGVLEVAETGLNLPPYDYIAVTYPTATGTTYTFKRGGSGGTQVAVVALVFTDSNKTDLVTVTKTPTT